MTSDRRPSSFDLATGFVEGRLSAEDVTQAIARWPLSRCRNVLRDAGIAVAELPSDLGVLARLTAAVLVPETLDASRSGGVPTLADLAAGRLFEGDPPELIARFADRSRGTIRQVRHASGGMLRIDDELALPAEVPCPPRHDGGPPVTPGDDPPIGPGDDPPVTPEDPVDWCPPDEELDPPGEPIGDREVLRVNLKVVFWIPYYPNELPTFSRILPTWKGEMAFREEYAMKGLFAVGNPVPPDRFPTKKTFDAFVASKEYRGIIDVDVQICRVGGRIVRTVVSAPNFTVGFTPSFSAVPTTPADTLRERLGADHAGRETLASQVSRAIKQGGVLTEQLDLLGLARLGIADRLDVAIPQIVENAKRSGVDLKRPDSYTQGNLRTEAIVARVDGDCLEGRGRMGIQVNNVENLFFYLLTGALLPYMWGRLRFTVCPTGKVKASVSGSSIPSKALYLNNRRVATYDMTKVGFDVIKVSVPFAPRERDDAFLPDPSKITPAFASTPGGSQLFASEELDFVPGCPAGIPTNEWPYDERMLV